MAYLETMPLLRLEAGEGMQGSSNRGRKYKVERGYVCSAGTGVGVGVVSSSVTPEKRTDRRKG